MVVAMLGVQQGPERIQVGRATAIYWPKTQRLAGVLAEQADASQGWPGLPAPPQFPFRIIVTPDQATFDSVTEGRLPGWGQGAAFPGTNSIVLIAGPNVSMILRHELAHLTLRNAVGRLPLWFEEGYASRAAGEWGRLDALRVNWAMVRGRLPDLPSLNRHLRGGAASAGASYALATTAVLYLERLGGERGLAPLFAALSQSQDLDRSLRQAYGMSLGQFEGQWMQEVRRRHGWLLVMTSFSVFWAVVALTLLLLWARRRRRDRERRAALDQGWVLPGEDDLPTS